MMKRLTVILCLVFLLSYGICLAGEDGIDVKVLTKTGSSWDGSPLPEYKSVKPEITILKITIPPGVALPMHKHPVINLGFMLKGELKVFTEEGKVLHLKEGDPIVEVVDTWHYGKNEGTSPAVIIVFYTGYENTPLTIYRK
ncbi:MAG: cupin domain-containing protein [Syntrophorhabdaceae bacterium]|nr:cupin domain-containing protein [Syntrophorhabdaceae bacterium]